MSTDYKSWNKFKGDNIPSSLDLAPDIYDFLKTSDRIIDLGCGFGKTCFDLFGQGFSHVTGVDVNISGIDYAKSRADMEGVRDSISFSVQDVTKLAMEDSFFTFAIMQALLTALPDKQDEARVFAEASRVLRPDGLLYIADFAQSWHISSYRERYMAAIRDGYEEGSFPVYSSETGDLEYVAHHFTEKELVLLLIGAGFAVVHCRYDRFKTRSGNEIGGMVLVARNNKDSMPTRSSHRSRG